MNNTTYEIKAGFKWDMTYAAHIGKLLNDIGINSFKINTISFRSVEINGKIYIMRKSRYCVNYSAVIVSDGMSGKMEHIPSISTSCRKNTYCVERCNSGDPDCICTHCFAVNTLQGYSGDNLSKVLAYNYDLLTSEILPDTVLPVFNDLNDIVRFESFGDLQNAIQAINYINIAKLNPDHTFAIWSKNMWILKTAADYCGGIPGNMIVIESSPYIDQELNTCAEIVEKTFTVLSSNDGRINCCDGITDRHCNDCRRCYAHNGDDKIYELLR